MGFVVLKFGGTSVSSRARWETIAARVTAVLGEGHTPVVVCSAVSGITSALASLLDGAVAGEGTDATLKYQIGRNSSMSPAMLDDSTTVWPRVSSCLAVACTAAAMEGSTPHTGDSVSTRIFIFPGSRRAAARQLSGCSPGSGSSPNTSRRAAASSTVWASGPITDIPSLFTFPCRLPSNPSDGLNPYR